MAADAGYFPPMPRSHRSSISSGSDMVTPDMLEKTPAPAPQHRTATALAAVAATSHPTKTLDPLARQYPVPAGELNLDELLAREPRKWTLGHYLTTPTREVPPPVQDKERRAKELEAAKKELLEGWGSMQNLGARHR
ncbi:hypothetical protein NKR23_g2357 [Pleurostoma richardsiae]|uniref:Uncharacterized protein n=1 Tax=Pleurostoma richardsiae TaxID=41990 RepID=A0AA38S242_9PEZI|nr:hypothetical protein NKR23_g2357 [Pleurostoma richardsiae]